MARQEVDIGIVGNDGTGDSIREAFRKVNDNFKEIYAVFNLGESISLQDLGNVPNELGPNRVLTTDDTGNNIIDRILEEGDGIQIDTTSDPTKIVINATGTSVYSDFNPKLGGPLDANGFVIAGLKEPSADAVAQFNTVHGPFGVSTTINEIAISKGYADKNYIRKTGGSSSSNGQIRVRYEPLNSNEYTLTINSYSNNNIVITAHGFDSGIDGAAYTYNSTGINATGLLETIPVTNAGFIIGLSYKIVTKGNTPFINIGALRGDIGEVFTLNSTTGVAGTTGTVKPVYFLKYVNADQLSVHTSFNSAQLGINKIDVFGGNGIQTLTDAYYIDTIPGNWLSNEVLPRTSVVRREGDSMTGVLNLSDHPFPLQGAGTPNRPDDLQAATKYYVDNSSFASQVDLYVSTTGNDIQMDTPPGKEGRAWAYSYRTVGKACERAEHMMNNAPLEPGPYRQLISFTTLDAGVSKLNFSVITNYTQPGVTGVGRIKFTNNGGTRVDQGKSPNVDIIAGKLVRGRYSGATGLIYDYQNDNTSTIGEDYVDIQYVTGTFLVGENLEFGDPVKNLHITIHVESGIYEEDYPIKLPANTAIVGDEFRRVLIRPRDRISQSPWADTWFFRNSQFDDLNIVSGGTQFDANLTGWYGYHYLKKPNKLVDRGPVYTNLGNYTTEAQTILTDKPNIEIAVLAYIEGLTSLSTIQQVKSKRDTGFIVDAIVHDLTYGGMQKIIELQDIFNNVTTLSPSCITGMGYIDDIINNSTIPGASQAVKDLITNMINKLVYAFNNNFNTPKNNKDIDVFLCNDATIIRQVTCQGHGGFMMVFDPNGQILTKSPYCQQSGTFSNSINQKAFRGGQYIDGFNGNLTPQVTQRISPTQLKITGIPRAPLTPTSFFLSGSRYKVDTWIPVAGADTNSGDLIKLNKYFLQAQTISHINSSFPGVKYPFGEIERLIDRIIDGLAFDVPNGGNSKTLEACRKFFNLSDESLRFSSTLKPLLSSMVGYIRDNAAKIIINGPVDENQDVYNQIKDMTRSGLSTSQQKIEDLLNNVIDCIEISLDEADNLNFPSFVLAVDNATPTPDTLTTGTYITLITPGNTSMLSNDYTQVNDLGYGIVTNNNGLAECVSVFSYYCWTSMFSNNGGQIRSLNSSSANGEYGLVSAGSDPTEIPDVVTFADNSMQVAKVVKRNTGNNDLSSSGEVEALFIYIDSFQYVPYNVSIVEINHGSTIGIIRYEMNNVNVIESDANGNATIVKLNFNTAGNNDSATTGLKAALANGDKIILRSAQNFKFYGVADTNPVRPSTALTLEGDPTNDINAPVYRVISYNTKGPSNEDLNPIISNPGNYNVSANLINAAKLNIQNAVVTYINTLPGGPLTATEETKSRRDTGYIVDAIVSDFTTGDIVEVTRVSQSINSADLDPNCKAGILYIATYINTSVIAAASTAEKTLITNIINKIYTGDQAILTVDTTYQYIGLIVDFTKVNNVDPANAAKKLGGLAGDNKIAIRPISEVRAIDRLNSAQMLTAWDGKIHRILSYTDVPATNYAYITISDLDIDNIPLQNLNSPVIAGLNSSLSPTTNLTLKPDSDIVLRAGLAKGERANITVRISTMRATGHDFLDIGTGGYNTSNYPSKIYGPPKDPNQAREVDERTRGRVFYVSTDQDGFFRVGRFFTVDQGTGTVTFSASIALSNLDGIGFKRGISVSEFSSDDKFTDLAQDAVPTEAAISGYIDRRLGMNRQGLALDPSELFLSAPGFMDRKGTLGPLEDIDWAQNRILNLGNPDGVYDATNKFYVDTEVGKYNKLAKLNDVVMDSAARGDIMAFYGTPDIAMHATVGGDLTATLESLGSSTLTEKIFANTAVVAIKVANSSGFPSSGYVVINNEIFSYSTKNSGGANQLNGVVRLSVSSLFNGKFSGLAPDHEIGATVFGLSAAVVNYQIKPNIIVNADIKNDAAILQSKLALNLATTSNTTPNPNTTQVGSFIIGKRYRIKTVDNTDYVALGASDNNVGTVFQATATGLFTAPNLINSKEYTIVSIGTTDFVVLGSTNNNIGNTFVANGPGVGSGTARQGSGTADEFDALQATAGLASFDSANFEITNGWVGIKNGGVSRIEQANVTADRIIGNLTANATFPQEILPENVLKRGIWNAINPDVAQPTGISTSTISKDHVITFRPGSPGDAETGSLFFPTEINVNVSNNTIVKRTAQGAIKASKITTDGSVVIIEANTTVAFGGIPATGTQDNNTPVVYKGQWSYGQDATFRATTANAWHTTRTITVKGDASGTVSIDGSSNQDLTVSLNAKLKILLRDGTTITDVALSV